MYENDHGDERHLTMEDLRRAAEAAGVGIDQVARNIQQAVSEPAGMPKD
jgi:hypothetical protein